MKTLNEICAKYKVGGWPDKGDVHSYLEVYSEVLAPYRESAKTVLEIGLMSGESLRMWTEYFSNAKVYGMDIDVKPIGGIADLSSAIADGYPICIGDAADPNTIAKFFTAFRFDVVIEDANHDIDQQLSIYRALRPYMAPSSIYIIEDVQDIDSTRDLFLNIDPGRHVEILDRRAIKGRYDDVLVIIK